jgi:plasmid stabilization system protein ParE
MAFTVVIRRRAQADIAGQVAWLEATRGIQAAVRWRSGLLTAVVSTLESDPHRHSLADEATDLGIALRELLHGRRRQVFRILFTIDGDSVNVLRVRHALQDRLKPGDV